MPLQTSSDASSLDLFQPDQDWLNLDDFLNLPSSATGEFTTAPDIANIDNHAEETGVAQGTRRPRSKRRREVSGNQDEARFRRALCVLSDKFNEELIVLLVRRQCRMQIRRSR